mmetsp:Transcript_43760/g.69580  ORF Transcript_43760/g.69580 Transcript_43760/m.69580 type:complete len:123 (+) Transcript_43760:224-592(+)
MTQCSVWLQRPHIFQLAQDSNSIELLEDQLDTKESLATLLKRSWEYFLRIACKELLSIDSRIPHNSRAHALISPSECLLNCAMHCGHVGNFKSLLLKRAAAAAMCEGVYCSICTSRRASSAK